MPVTATTADAWGRGGRSGGRGGLTPRGWRTELPLFLAAYLFYFVRAESGLLEVETGALPLSGPAGYHGAIVVFWPLPSAEGS
jgi:hypothetical protein